MAVMTSVLRQMTEYQYSQYITRFETPFDLLDYLMEILMIFEELITRNVYPPDWNEMILLQNWSVFWNLIFKRITNLSLQGFSEHFEVFLKYHQEWIHNLILLWCEFLSLFCISSIFISYLFIFCYYWIILFDSHKYIYFMNYLLFSCGKGSSWVP